jgi:hypothetical protein
VVAIAQVEHDPQATADHDQDQEAGKEQCHQVLVRRPLEVDMVTTKLMPVSVDPTPLTRIAQIQ